MEHRFGTFAVAITLIHRGIQQIKTAEMKQYGLKAVHVMCLYLLALNPQGLSVSGLVERTGEDKAAISRALKELREKGLVVFAEDVESRSYRIPLVLTAQGAELAEELRQKIHDIFAECAPDVSEEDREAFYRVLLQITKNVHDTQKELA